MIKLILTIALGAAAVAMGYFLGVIVTHSDNWGKGDEEETDYDTRG